MREVEKSLEPDQDLPYFKWLTVGKNISEEGLPPQLRLLWRLD
jgi:hypothetical protein